VAATKQPAAVSRMQPPARTRRAWIAGIIAFFVVMCAAIAIAQWWAIHKNVPYYQSKLHATHPR
jgi:multidrug resistance efflux pump